MPTKRFQWTATLGVMLGLPGLGIAEDVVWRAVTPNSPPPAITAVPAPSSAGPIATLGRPIASAASAADVAPVGFRLASGSAPAWSAASGPIVRAQAPEPLPPGSPPPTPPFVASLSAEALPPTTALIPPSGPVSAADMAPPLTLGPAVPPPGGGPFLPASEPAITPTGAPTGDPHVAYGPPDAVPAPASTPFAYNPAAPVDRPVGASAWDKFRGWFSFGDKSTCEHRGLFQSDTVFTYLASPVTNPFFFEDPRSLTEVRPIFMYQSIPNSNPTTHGGSAYFFGTQARLALTENFSLVMNELGLVSIQPKDATPDVPRDTGFAEIKVGPKWTFFHRSCDTSGTIAAAGLTFEFPVGSSRVAQDTGNLSLDPYLTFGQHWRLPGGFGSLNLLAAGGYSASIDSKRAEFLHASMHLDYNVANTNFFPLMELNYFHYTSGGNVRDIGFEGGDLVNFGSSSVGQRDLLNLAFGLRYKCSEHLQFGGAVEFPLTSTHSSFEDLRVTFDVILRY